MEAVAKMDHRHATIEQTYRTERKRLLEFIRKRVRRDQDAEDILQDVFYQLIAGYSVTEPIEKLTSWLFTVARNKITDWYRKRRPEPLPVNKDDPFVSLDLEEILFDPRQNPDQVHARSLIWEELAEALDELPDEQREVFVMHELEGKGFKEIAELTGDRSTRYFRGNAMQCCFSEKGYMSFTKKSKIYKEHLSMRHRWILRIVKGIAFFAVLVLALGFIVMFLWNGIIPNLFKGPSLTYWQAVGLLLLSHILLRGWAPWRCGGGWRYGRWRQRFEERLAAMTPEEREVQRRIAEAMRLILDQALTRFSGN